MLFDVAVKEDIKDFYNYRKELKELKASIEAGDRLIVIKGPRRVGKTSLMRVVFGSLSMPKAWIDARKIFVGVSAEGLLYDSFLSILRQLKVEERLLARIETISFGGVEARIRPLQPSIVAEETDNELRKKNMKAIIFIDEAQLLKKHGVDRFLAYVYDHLKAFQLVVAGSQVGLLEEFVGRSGEAPLFGRAKTEIEIRRLEKKQSAAFLREGFREARIKVPENEQEQAISTVDGLIGWLTYYGYYRTKHPHEKAMELLKRDAREITSSEIKSFLASRKGEKTRYLTLMKALCAEPLTWEKLKTYLEVKEKKRISDGRMNEYLSKLLAYGFVEKVNGEYALSDPLIKEALG